MKASAALPQPTHNASQACNTPDCDDVRDSNFKALDALCTLIAVVDAQQGVLLFVNSALEAALSQSRRTMLGSPLAHWFSAPALLEKALSGVCGHDYSALRLEADLQPPRGDSVPVFVTLSLLEPAGHVMVEMWPLQQQAKQEREERIRDQAQLNKELIRNLAHEIKNPLGGIRGAAQLLQMELATPELREYTTVVIREADRLQTLVDRLLAPHRQPHEVGDVNIHAVCEHVRTLVLSEYPQGLKITQDYDISIPEFRGDALQLIQALLNLVQNAAQALSAQIAQGSAEIILRTRVARQVTLGRERHKLALELHVIDNGSGVPDDIRERIFSPLVSGREGGSGLGLTLAQTFVQQHQGLIEFESQPGCTDFTMLIPLP